MCAGSGAASLRRGCCRLRPSSLVQEPGDERDAEARTKGEIRTPPASLQREARRET